MFELLLLWVYINYREYTHYSFPWRGSEYRYGIDCSEELLSLTIELRLRICNYCDRHFNCKNAVWSVGFIVVQFFKCNLQFNMRNKSARRRLPFNGRLAFVRIFLFLDKIMEAKLCKTNRQFNTALRLMTERTFRSVMKKNQRPFLC